ncbi:MAG: hypothetical protein NZ951_01370 [Dehalococcoidia bacterium]|nr:hypothetical protein [Dehalococcoidia bacterium]MDW8119482.1 hypothetical protein [Chloroflexota bacterium]
MTLPALRALLRQDLRDTDPTAYRWSDADLDRHLQHAARDLSLAVPREATVEFTTTPGSRTLSLASLPDLVRVEAVEYPVDRWPPSYVLFSLWGTTLTLLVDTPPAGAEPVRLYYGRLHTLTATTSTIPSYLEELVVMGASGYAALEWASYATNRVNPGGPETWQHFLTWGKERLTLFQRSLDRLSARNRVRPRRLYTPAHTGAARTHILTG